MGSNTLGLHTPRLEARRGALKKVFARAKMEVAWQKFVREGLRNQQVFDLFDYNDFHFNRLKRFQDLQRAIISGRYRPTGSIPAKVEKSLGVCRTIIIPSPEDAVVLQCIVENLLHEAGKRQPSKNAFFSRSHKNNVGNFQFDSDYIWFKQWRKFSDKRMEFTSTHQWIVTTDIATFFDNVRYSNLRNIVSSFNNQHEVVLDILIDLLDGLCWKPDYVPSSKIGLPQVQFDGPRLLAHIYLFEIDAYIKAQTDDNFVRWVDDMTIAVRSRQHGKVILRDLDSLLQIRGLRLNSAKTRILSASEAAVYFQKSENASFDSIKAAFDAAKKAKTSTLAAKGAARMAFKALLASAEVGHRDKVIRRYIGLAAEMRSNFALKYVLTQFEAEPAMRESIYRYLSALGPRLDVFRGASAYLLGDDAVDDASVCHVVQTLIDWEVDRKDLLFKKLRSLAMKLCKPEFVRNNPHRFSAALALSVKYRTEGGLVSFVKRTEFVWSRSEFMARQVCAALSRVKDGAVLEWAANVIAPHAYRSAFSVIHSIRRFRDVSIVPGDVRLYVLNGNNKTTYKIHRLLIALTVLRSSGLKPAYKASLKASILKILTDPVYRSLIKAA